MYYQLFIFIWYGKYGFMIGLEVLMTSFVQIIVSAWELIPPSKPQTSNFFSPPKHWKNEQVPQGRQKDQIIPTCCLRLAIPFMLIYNSMEIEFVETQKRKYVMQTSKHIFQICIDCIIHNHIFLKIIFSLGSDMFREMFYLLCCFALAELKCFCALPSLMCLLPNNLL